MDNESMLKIVGKGRLDLIENHFINQSGFAGITPWGQIVDRRDSRYDQSVAIQKNDMLAIPFPKVVNQWDKDAYEAYPYHIQVVKGQVVDSNDMHRILRAEDVKYDMLKALLKDIDAFFNQFPNSKIEANSQFRDRLKSFI